MNKAVFKTIGLVLAALLVAMLFFLPMLGHYGNDSTLFTVTLLLASVGTAISWNLTGGFTGYVDFGHAVWWGIGAYTTGVLMSNESEWIPQQWPLVPALIVSMFFTALVANLVGRLTMRLSGPYFSIAMLGFFVFFREVVRVVGPLTNRGIGLTIKPVINRPLWYYITLIFVLFLVYLSWWLRRTRFGASLIAIREDEIGAEMRGIDTTRNKVMVFTLSGAITGLLGGMWAYQNTFLDPDIAFVEVRTIDAVMGTMLGGLGTVAGPIIGMVFLFVLRELLWTQESLLQTHLIVQGLLLGAVVLYLPKGLMGLVRGEVAFLDRFRERSSTFDGMESAVLEAQESSISDSENEHPNDPVAMHPTWDGRTS